MSSSSSGRTVSDVLHDILGNIQDIVRSEVRLAKIELRDGLMQSGRVAMLFAIGGVTGFFAVLFLLLTVMFALFTVMPGWAAALVVAAALGLGCGLAIAAATRHLKRIRVMPVTTSSIKENIQWSKHPT
ncbi:MAG: phage holin family protein [Pseudomonadota bacterium]|nr:phage holin family protein [Pseudomonadota bacterium]